jgi:hypothetical protein
MIIESDADRTTKFYICKNYKFGETTLFCITYSTIKIFINTQLRFFLFAKKAFRWSNHVDCSQKFRFNFQD